MRRAPCGALRGVRAVPLLFDAPRSEGEASDYLTAPRLGASAIEPIDITETGRQQPGSAVIGVIVARRRKRIRCGTVGWKRVEHTVENVVDLRPDLKQVLAFPANPEGSPEVHALL